MPSVLRLQIGQVSALSAEAAETAERVQDARNEAGRARENADKEAR